MLHGSEDAKTAFLKKMLCTQYYKCLYSIMENHQKTLLYSSLDFLESIPNIVFSIICKCIFSSFSSFFPPLSLLFQSVFPPSSYILPSSFPPSSYILPSSFPILLPTSFPSPFPPPSYRFPSACLPPFLLLLTPDLL